MPICKAITLQGAPCKNAAKKGLDFCNLHDPDPAAVAARRAASSRGGRGRRPKSQRLAPTLTPGDFSDPSKRSQVFGTLKWEVHQGILDPKQAHAIVALDGREHGDDARIAREILERMEQTQQAESRLAQPSFELDIPSRFKNELEEQRDGDRESESATGGEQREAQSPNERDDWAAHGYPSKT